MRSHRSHSSNIITEDNTSVDAKHYVSDNKRPERERCSRCFEYLPNDSDRLEHIKTKHGGGE